MPVIGLIQFSGLIRLQPVSFELLHLVDVIVVIVVHLEILFFQIIARCVVVLISG